MATMTRKHYAEMYGPTTGDAVRLADSSLLAEIEQDFGVPGEECLHGGGKTLRDGLGLAAGYDSAMGSLDMLICNVVVIDPVLGIVKGDIGIKEGRIVRVGKAGNPAIMDGVDRDMVCGAATTVRDGEGLIATPGGLDCHVMGPLPSVRLPVRLSWLWNADGAKLYPAILAAMPAEDARRPMIVELQARLGAEDGSYVPMRLQLLVAQLQRLSMQLRAIRILVAQWWKTRFES